ncbi:MAG: YfhO family protein [Deltaproteobacteria bacterium]|nr:YfhO family protein [Deltaproteobacteria bacterium]
MSGSSYAMARGFALVPWLLLSVFTDIVTAGKLTALAAIFASAVAMYVCARHFLKQEWAAVVSALVFILHPQQLIHAAAAEHLTISLFFPLIPLLWLALSRALESNRFRDTFLCALLAVLAWWTDNKQAFINFAFLGAYVVYWLWPRRQRWRPIVRTCALLAVLGLTLGAPFLVPGLVESKNVKLFADDPVRAWQATYSLKDVLQLVDRNGIIAATAAEDVAARAQIDKRPPRDKEEADQVQRIFALRAFSAEKYAGIVALALIIVTVFWGDQRTDAKVFRFCLVALLVSVVCASGLDSVASANWETGKALWLQGQTTAALAVPVACVAFLVALWAVKWKTARQRVMAAAALTCFLVVPGFRILALLPYFDTIRAPFVFYDGPGTFWVAILSGFFVTDVVGRSTLRRFQPALIAALALLLLIDYWPYQKSTRQTDLPLRTLTNLAATYGSLAQDLDWVKTYSVSNRYFHLLGPMYSGKPQAYEAFNDWLAPVGMGALNQAGAGSHPLFDLLGVRYVVVDKSDPGSPPAKLRQLLDLYRQQFHVVREDDDFVLFRNPTAHGYVAAYARSCTYIGDVRESARLSLALSERNWPLVQSDMVVPSGRYEKAYRQGEPASVPERDGETVPLSDLHLDRGDAEHIGIHLKVPQSCLVVVAESYYPYWRAEVDGKPVDVLRVSTGLMGLELSEGVHDITLRYRKPPAYALAALVSLLTLAAGVAVLACGSTKIDGWLQRPSASISPNTRRHRKT